MRYRELELGPKPMRCEYAIIDSGREQRGDGGREAVDRCGMLNTSTWPYCEWFQASRAGSARNTGTSRGPIQSVARLCKAIVR